MDGFAASQTVDTLTQNKPRQVALKNKRGDLYGVNWTSPDGDFARLLGYKPETAAEKGGAEVSGRRAIELAMRENFQKLGEGAMQRHSSYRNMWVSVGRYANQPGREREMINDGMHAYSTAVENTHELNMRYLELQYRMNQVGKSFSTISQMMRVRHEAVKKAVNEVR